MTYRMTAKVNGKIVEAKSNLTADQVERARQTVRAGAATGSTVEVKVTAQG